MEEAKDVYFDYRIMPRVKKATRKQHSSSMKNEKLPEQTKQ
jgi:hypothetical protein